MQKNEAGLLPPTTMVTTNYLDRLTTYLILFI